MKSRSSILLALFCICSACESKPVKPMGEKLTSPQSPQRQRMEFEVKTLTSPGSDQRVESAIVLSGGVQDCLRQALQQNSEIVVEIAGKLSAGGKITAVQVTQSDGILRGCLVGAVKKITVEPGPAGPFRVRLARVTNGKPGAKTILLDKREPKKFQ